jgi:hypothetical protein
VIANKSLSAVLALGISVLILIPGCGGSSELAISCDDFLTKGEAEQSDIARSFGSKSLYGDDDPAPDDAIPDVQGYQDSLVAYCSDPEHGGDNLSDLDAEASFSP